MTGPEPIKVPEPPPRVGAVGRELRKLVEQRLRTALQERGWRRGGSKGTWVSDQGMEPPLQARLSVDVDTTRYQEVRIAGYARVAVPGVEELLSDAPEEALSGFERIYRGSFDHPVARAGFAEVDGVPRRRPPEWQAQDESQLDAAVDGFLAHLDGPVSTWFSGRSTVADVRGADGAVAASGHGDAVRAVAALEALLGDLPAARARLARYREDPGGDDSAEQVDAFTAWLEQAVATRDPGR